MSSRSATDPSTATVDALRPLALERAAVLGRSEPVRSTTPLGTVDAGAIADVDGAGLVQLRGVEWSLDWWVGAEDRWHHPSREAAVRQRWIDGSPVVETAMRVPGGDVVHRAYGVRATSASDDVRWEDSAVVVEVENLTAVPVAVAFAVRPVTLDGSGSVRRVSNDGSVVSVDGRVAAVLSRVAARTASGRRGEPAELLLRGEDADPSVTVDRIDGDVEVAFVVPLTHTSVVRVVLPRVARPQRGAWRRRPEPVGPTDRWDAPDAAAVSAGWAAHTRDAVRVELPDPSLGEAVTASQRSLVLAAGDGFLEHAVGADAVCEALAVSGLAEPLGPLARALVAAQRLNGSVRAADGDATVALVHAAAGLLAEGRGTWSDDLLGPAAKAVHRLRRDLPAATATTPADAAGAALARLAVEMRRIEQPDVADEAERLAVAPPSAESPVNAGGGSLAATALALRGRIRSGDDTAVAALVDLVRLGSAGTLVDRVDGDGVPAGETGFDPAAVSARLCAVLDVAAVDLADGPALLPAWPAAWWGQQAELHRLRTRWGLLSFAVRWHGERPAVLWEIEPLPGAVDGGPAPVLTAPGLDPAWRGEGWSGDALLAAVPVPPTTVAIRPSAVVSGVAVPPPAPIEGGALDAGESFS